MTKSTLILFDLDGTIMTTMGVGLRAMRRAGRELFGDAFDLEGVNAGGMIDPHLFRIAFRRSGFEASDGDLAAFIEGYAAALTDELAKANGDVAVLPGMIDLLDAVHAHGDATLGLLTGNFTRTGPIKLAAAGIDAERFAVRVFGDDGPDRPSLVPVAMSRYAALHGRAVEPRDVIVVGDTPHDVGCAKAHGARCLAVATGPFPYDDLVDSGADVVVRDLSDAGVLWGMIG